MSLYRTTIRLYVKGYEYKVMIFKKTLYGLNKAPKAWNNRID